MYYLFGMIFWVRVVFRKTVVGDWCLEYLSSSQSQVKSRHQVMVQCIYASGLGFDWSVLSWCDWLSKRESCVIYIYIYIYIYIHTPIYKNYMENSGTSTVAQFLVYRKTQINAITSIPHMYVRMSKPQATSDLPQPTHSEGYMGASSCPSHISVSSRFRNSCRMTICSWYGCVCFTSLQSTSTNELGHWLVITPFTGKLKLPSAP